MSIPPKLYLIDTSAWARLSRPPVKRRLDPIIKARAAATCLPLDLEDGRSARDIREGIRIRTLRADVMTELPITPEVATRARDLQLLLARQGHHRSAGPTDLIAAAAAAEFGATVIHYDHDYDLIAAAGGPRCEWVVPRGSLS